ncbi:DUF7312 domain-containing protein [Halogranum rubrum]|uniref:DUF7312 domain-containing protein n=1 Tax=Halogranum salarium B-1 TaxID=1210908 RepID=J3JH58_9EURY|nr:hypothetical protein [Halogranum salarium]EJN60701.1 hypothetical protein HSB1_13040 [Halogranum salarium B-1]
MQNPSDDSSEDSEWQFSVDEVGEEAANEPTEERTLPPLEPGDPSFENALFVLIGVVGTLLIFVSL